MLRFFKNKDITVINNSFASIGLDFHSHLLPSVDDGCQSVEESLTILNYFQDLGYRKIYTSPHIMGEKYILPKAELQARFDIFCQEPSIKGLNIQLGLIAEYLLDENFEKLLIQNDFLTLPEGHILIETSMNYDFPFVREYIYELVKKGYKPILAHPERYRYIYTEDNYIDKYDEMLDWGIEFQLNIFALIGLYGDTSKKVAEQLIDKGFYSYACSDLHRPNQLNYFEELKKSLFLKKLIDSGQLKNKQFI